MDSVYHAGEIEVQTRAGVRTQSERIGRSVHSRIPYPAHLFMMGQPMVIVSSVDGGGRVWASLLTGEPGFAAALDDSTVLIDARPVAGDPLSDNLSGGGAAAAAVGLLFIEPRTRRRMRLNGRAVMTAGGIRVRTSEVYTNCPKYIQAREWESIASESVGEKHIKVAASLADDQRDWITRADTFFIASYHPEGGGDASHRGGCPGFVRASVENKLLWPDYSGNQMFNTLGNIAAYKRAGLLFVDFEGGDTLQLTGEARVVWDEERAAEFEGAERLVELQVEQAIETTNASPLRWRFLEYSPFNPDGCGRFQP
ncbi:MAG TPA: pyridoxamine 5'-phosphate oxidase family protein [Pyrinomonadaceae bacterium]|nr:pyridoxamine 5'-phosphate oxidase family protein [Pyrinomonadaceae bacterium]